MSRTGFSKFVLVALALALWVSAAYGQVTATPSSIDLGAYVLSSDPAVMPTASFVVTAASSTPYTATPTASPAWYTVTCGGTATTLALGADICTIVLNANADSLSAGLNSDTLVLTTTVGSNITNVTVSFTAVASTSPTTLATSSTVNLFYISGGVANQGTAKTNAVITSTDSSSVSYSVTSTLPGWLTVTPATGTVPVSPGSDNCAFVVSQTAANSLPPGVTTATVDLAVGADGGGVLPVVVTLTVIPAQPLTWSTSGTPIYFGWVKGTSVSTTAQDATITYTGTAASMPFTVNPATVPLWLTVSAGSGQAVGGATATFTLAAGVVPALAAGNYTANVFFTATGAQSSLSIAVTLTVANTAATASIKEITAALGNTGCLTIGNCTIPNIFTMTANPVAPVPTVTVLSSDEPISFAATCTATTTYLTFVPTASPCQLSGASTTAASVSGVAYTWGTQMKANLASGLFAFGTPYGAVVTVTVTVSTTSLTSPQTLTLFYTYKIQPSDPTFTAISPTSAASATTTDLVVTLTGTNFVGPGNIINNGISPTKVFAGSVDVTANSVVMPGGNAIVVSLSPPFPAIVSPAKTSTLTISLGNQTGASAPAAPGKFSQTLTFTTSPVVYSVTSTASYVQPVAPQKPAVAPFELVSIFGANFTSGSSASGTTDAFGRFGTAVAIGGTVSAPVNLSVVFKSGSTSYSAPILYANATQINAIVPSGLPAGTATVWVTSGTATSDGSFAVTVNAADPGIFTLSSEGVGQGAILNSDYSVNSLTNATTAGSFVQLYVTGLGIPTSSGVDAASNTAAYPGGCVGVSGAAPANPTYVGYLQAANSTGITGWTKPTSPWTNLDGVVINSKVLLDVPGSGLPGLAPCFTTGSTPTTPVTVTFTTPTGTTVTQSGNTEVSWAGFASGSVAGLYQINVTVPAGLVATPGTAQNVPVSIAIGAATSPAGVTLAVK